MVAGHHWDRVAWSDNVHGIDTRAQRAGLLAREQVSREKTDPDSASFVAE